MDSADRFVTENRTTFALAVPLIGAAILIAGSEGAIPATVAFGGLLVVLGAFAMRVPLVVGLAPLVRRRFALAVLGLALFAYAIESVAVATGWPYGWFEYGLVLGPTLFGVPVALPLFYVPLVVNAYLLTVLVFGETSRLVRVPVAIATVVLIDLVLDPAAVALGFWAYVDGGVYYDVPVSNYVGWVLSGTVAVLVLEFTMPRAALADRFTDAPFLLDDTVSFVLLWSVVNAAYGNWVAVAAAIPIGAGVVYAHTRGDQVDTVGTDLAARLSGSWNRSKP